MGSGKGIPILSWKPIGSGSGGQPSIPYSEMPRGGYPGARQDDSDRSKSMDPIQGGRTRQDLPGHPSDRAAMSSLGVTYGPSINQQSSFPVSSPQPSFPSSTPTASHGGFKDTGGRTALGGGDDDYESLLE